MYTIAQHFGSDRWQSDPIGTCDRNNDMALCLLQKLLGQRQDLPVDLFEACCKGKTTIGWGSHQSPLPWFTPILPSLLGSCHCPTCYTPTPLLF
jgi:hypothetical protein